MRRSVRVLLFAVAGTGLVWGAGAPPKVTAATPPFALAGEAVSVAGENLGKDVVAGLFLTDGKNDVQLTLTGQTASELKTKLPGDVQSGRWRIMLLTGGDAPQYLEQPIVVTVETAEERTSRKAKEAAEAEAAKPKPEPPAEEKPADAPKP